MIKKYFTLFLLTMIVGSVKASEASDSVVVHTISKPAGNLNLEEQKKKKNIVKRILPEPSYRRVGKPAVFVPKGQWIVGATVAYSENSAENYEFLILKDIQTSGYNVKTEAFVGRAMFNDGVLGVRMGYQRTLLDLKKLDIHISDDINLNLDDYYSLNHSFVGTVFLRNYISLFNSNRFGLFNDTQVSVESGQGKTMNGKGETLSGVYTENTKFSVGISPGLTVFINDFAAFEASVGVLGFESEWVNQTKDQVEMGKYRKSSANFKVNLFSLRLGMTFYLNPKKVNAK